MHRKSLLLAALLLGLTMSLVAAVPTPEAASSCCRPQCAVDSNCDKICGPGNGVCRMVNSCCKACLCLAAF